MTSQQAPTVSRVVAVDVGSVPRSRFGWWALDLNGDEVIDVGRGRTPSGAVTAVCDALAARRPAALGLECPLFVPVPDDEQHLLQARVGEGNRAFAAGAGAGSTVTGLVELHWMLKRIRQRTPCAVTTRPERWDAERPLLLWEAFVTGPAKLAAREHPHGPDVGDAELAARAFVGLGPRLLRRGPVRTDHPTYNLAAASVVGAGLSIDPTELACEVRVVQAELR